jgi:type VI secretion system secreted protein Hcp
MSTNVYLEITGEDGKKFEGNSTAKGHEKKIEVVSWSHGFSQPTTAATKSTDQQATSRANHSDLSFTKFFDNASDDILKACWTGAQAKTAIFQCFRSSGADDTGASTLYLQITLEDLILSHYSISGGGDELPIENVTLNYTKCEYQFIPVDFETGKAEAGKKVAVSHDLSTNTIA